LLVGQVRRAVGRGRSMVYAKSAAGRLPVLLGLLGVAGAI
jgi:hypothetical protein